MTNRASPVTSGPADPPPLLTTLIITLTREAEVYARQSNRFDGLIDVGVPGIRAEFQARSPGLRGQVMRDWSVELQRTRRDRWYVGVFALAVVIIGAAMSYLVIGMAQEMNRMEDYMYNMGHSVNDDRPIAQDERKTASTSYISAMAEHMQAMREEIGAMRHAITRMDGGIASMSSNMKSMSKDMATMSYTMGLLRQDTAMIGMSVGSMSKDTRSMGAPFRFMSGFMPW